MASAEDITLIVNQSGQDGSADIFFQMPDTSLQTVLGRDPAVVFSNEGQVPIDDYRDGGNSDVADQVFGGLSVRASQHEVALEGFSLMLHLRNSYLPFKTPNDGYIAVSACTVPYVGANLYLGALDIFYGGSLTDPSGQGLYHLQFPSTGRNQVEMTVRSYIDGTLQSVREVSLADGETLTLDPKIEGQPTKPWRLPAIALGFIALLLIAVVARRRPTQATV